MGKDRRSWRKLVKKLRRKRIRTVSAISREAELKARWTKSLPSQLETLDYSTSSEDPDDETIESKLSEVEWQERERLAQIEFQKQKDDERRIIEKAEEEKAKLRKDWEAAQTKLIAELEEAKRIDEEKRLKQVSELLELEAEYNQFLDFLCGDIETPPLPFIMPEELDSDGKEVCGSFLRTATCRFGQNCRRSHPSPTLSQIIMISNFFSHYSLEKALDDEFDADLNLEYDDADLYKSFREFYEDVLPEFQKYGKVIQFKVCCNYEPHVRGNVYIQYENMRQAVEVYRVFNGRYFNGKQISLSFVRIDSWRAAICGMFSRKRCKMKLSCNFLHVFRNPTKEFVLADNDWKKNVPNTSNQRSPRTAGNHSKSKVVEASTSVSATIKGPEVLNQSKKISNGAVVRDDAISPRKTISSETPGGSKRRYSTNTPESPIRFPLADRRSHREDYCRSKSRRHESRQGRRSRSPSPSKRGHLSEKSGKSGSSSKNSKQKRQDRRSRSRSPYAKKLKKKHKHKQKKRKKRSSKRL